MTPSLYCEAYQNPVVLELHNANQIPKSLSPKNFGFDFEGLMYNLDRDLIRKDSEFGLGLVYIVITVIQYSSVFIIKIE